jgi:predicted glycoside hydrolase/deacetylase ChbG (UPF0249 family)
MMKIPSEKLIVTSDDFGISLGVNHAVIEAYLNGALTNASLLVSAKYFEAAIKLAKEKAPGLKLGLHINLTTGKPILPATYVPKLVDKEGKFKYGPVGLLFQTIIKPSILNEIACEIEAQIDKLKTSGVQICHLDGHHHVQMIPGIFPIILKLAEKYHIKRVRVVNESLLHTICKTHDLRFLINGGIARYALLKTLYIFNNYKTKTYFFSILNSCQITPELVKNISIPNGYDEIEIMLHPGNAEMDRDANIERPHLTSKYREIELQTAFALKRR